MTSTLNSGMGDIMDSIFVVKHIIHSGTVEVTAFTNFTKAKEFVESLLKKSYKGIQFRYSEYCNRWIAIGRDVEISIDQCKLI